jgi:hypothetical protein
MYGAGKFVIYVGIVGSIVKSEMGVTRHDYNVLMLLQKTFKAHILGVIAFKGGKVAISAAFISIACAVIQKGRMGYNENVVFIVIELI